MECNGKQYQGTREPDKEMSDRIQNIIRASIETKEQLLNDNVLIETLQKVTDVLADAFIKKNKLYLCGNGGSAADAQHIAAEFTGRFYKERSALAAEALHCNTSYLTAAANDFGFEDIYARLIDGIGKPGDILIGFSTSGNSANIVKAFEAARLKGVVTVGFTGWSGGQLKSVSDYLINIPSTDTPRIQEAHTLAGHILCELVEEKVFN